jgi:hypothetical protein
MHLVRQLHSHSPVRSPFAGPSAIREFTEPDSPHLGIPNSFERSSPGRAEVIRFTEALAEEIAP